ncbi:hypothetical protein ACNS7O_12625 [Haloferacaceae archaeon DSL9]
MAVISADQFVDRFASLSADERRALLAALWELRGWETAVEGKTVLARRDGEVRRIVVAGRLTLSVDDDVDVLVSASGRRRHELLAADAGARYRSPKAVYDLLVFGVDRAAAESLFEETFGRSLYLTPDELDPPPTLAERVGSVPPPAVGAVVVSVVALLLVFGGPPGGGPTGDNATNASTQSVVYPDGLNESDANVTVLAQATVEELDREASFAVRSNQRITTQDRRADDSATQSVRQHRSEWRAQSRERYAIHRETSGERTESFELLAYGDEVHMREIRSDGATSIESPDLEPAALFTQELGGLEHQLTRLLATNETRIDRVGEENHTFAVTATGEPESRYFRGVTDYEAVAHVTEDGVVTWLSATYTRENDGAIVERELDIRDVGEAIVSPPGWYDEVREEPEPAGREERPDDDRGGENETDGDTADPAEVPVPDEEVDDEGTDGIEADPTTEVEGEADP